MSAPKRPVRRPPTRLLIGLATGVVVVLAACGSPTSPAGPPTTPVDRTTPADGERATATDMPLPVPGTPEALPPIRFEPTAPAAFAQRAGQVAAAIRSSGTLAAYRDGLVLLSGTFIEQGYDTDEQKIAVSHREIIAGPGIPAGTPPAGQITFAGGGARAVDLVDARTALESAKAGGGGGCEGMKPPACPLTFTEAKLATTEVRTSRGKATVPAWAFRAPDLSRPLVIVAVAPGVFTTAPPPTSLPQAPVGLNGASVLIRAAADSLDVGIGHGACDRNLASHVVEFDDIVIVGGSHQPPPPDTACTDQYLSSPSTIPLSKPIGTRLVVNVGDGTVLTPDGAALPQ